MRCGVLFVRQLCGICWARKINKIVQLTSIISYSRIVASATLLLLPLMLFGLHLLSISGITDDARREKERQSTANIVLHEHRTDTATVFISFIERKQKLLIQKIFDIRTRRCIQFIILKIIILAMLMSFPFPGRNANSTQSADIMRRSRETMKLDPAQLNRFYYSLKNIHQTRTTQS